MTFGLNKHTIERFNEIFSRHPQIAEVIIYGSRAKGNYREGSDIDLTLKGNRVTEDICRKIWLELDELNTPYLIDLSIYNHLNSGSLKEHIDRVGKVFYTSVEREVPVV